MKSSILLLILMGMISLSCQNQANLSNAKDEKTEVLLNGLNDDHPNKKQMQGLINN